MQVKNDSDVTIASYTYGSSNEQRQLQRMPRVYLMVNNDPIILAMLNAIKEQQKESWS